MATFKTIQPLFDVSRSRAVISHVLYAGWWRKRCSFSTPSNYFPPHMINNVTLILLWSHYNGDSLTEDTACTAMGHWRLLPSGFRASEMPLSSRMGGFRMRIIAPGLLPGGALTGGRLFLNRTRDNAAGVPAVDSTRGIPSKPMSSFISRQIPIKASNQ